MLRDWFRPTQCKLFGHLDDKVAGRLDQVRCQRCGRKDPPDTTAADIIRWNAERE
jgi:hypothetical protein